MKCEICNKEKKLITHHLSYIPEIMENICWNCHGIMHRLSTMSQDQRDTIIGKVDKYGHLWKDGEKQYHKTKHYKEGKEKRKDNDRLSLQQHRFIKLNPEKMLDRIEKMEKIVEKLKQ